MKLPKEIVIHPNPILRTVCSLITEFGAELEEKVGKLKAAIQSTDNGIGIAAPQIGITERFFIITVDGKLITMVNPEILESEGQQICKEGCLSIPGMYYDIKRAAEVTVKYYDVEGIEHTAVFEGLQAVEVQHESEHLDGILFIDHLPKVKSGDFNRKYKIMKRKLKKAKFIS